MINLNSDKKIDITSKDHTENWSQLMPILQH